MQIQQIFFFFRGGGGGGIYQCGEYACMLHMILVRAHFSQNVKYLYEIRDILVPIFTRCEELVRIFHDVKFAKCEICGSTKPTISGLFKWRFSRRPIVAYSDVVV